LSRDDWRICAICITFNPDPGIFGRLLASIKPQVEAVVIVDNGTKAETLCAVDDLVAHYKAAVIKLGKNSGVAAAQNVGIRWAREFDYTHVLLLDHDSVPANDMVNRLVLALAYGESIGMRVAAVGPRYIDPRTGQSAYFVRFGLLKFKKVYCKKQMVPGLVDADFLISSGLLIPLSSIDEIGLMDERLFMDHVDTEWFLRARGLGFCVLGVCGAKMEHYLGDTVRKMWLGRWRNLRTYPAERFYYITRNSVLLYKRRYISRRWVLIDSIKLVLMFIIYSLLIPPRERHAMMFVRGFIDGWKGREGAFGKAINKTDVSV